MGMLNTLRNWYTSVFDSRSAAELNPQFDTFRRLDDDEEVALRKSVISQAFNVPTDPVGGGQLIGYDVNSAYTNFIYGSVSTSKGPRLLNYRSMSAFPEVADAIDEICDSMLNYDDDGNIVRLNIRSKDIVQVKEQILREEFAKFIELFDFEHNFYDYARTLIVDGQLAWENIVDEKDKEEGIIGLNPLPAESYDFLIDDNGIKRGLNIRSSDPGQYANTPSSQLQGNIQLSNINPKAPSDRNFKNNDPDQPALSIEKIELPMPWSQLTYVDTGLYSPDKLIVFPVLEKARKAYRQLSLIEDSILIYRLVRAPQRLVFNVDTGKLPRSKAEQEVYKLMKRFQTKKFYNPVTGAVGNDYDPHQLLESFWFPKPEGSQGTTVTTIGGDVNWTELPDLNYFLKKLYLSLKVPFDRFQNPSVKIEKGDNITAEEYRFAKFIMRLQDRFSIGLTKSFTTHLKLKGIWERYDLRDPDIKIQLTPPASYDLYEQQRLLKIKFENYKTMVGENPEISREMAMKKCLGFSDSDIEENNRRVQKEKMFMASLERAAANIGSTGNPFQGGK